jgi:hypothetical protein
VLVRIITARNTGPEPAEVHILPTLWFRNRWSWEDGVSKPVIRDMSDETGSVVIAEDEKLGAWKLVAGPDPAGRRRVLVCDNETNVPKVFGSAASTPYPKDGVNDHVVNGAATVNPIDAGRRWRAGTTSLSEPERLPRSDSGWPATLQAERSISATPSHKRKLTEAAKPTNFTRRFDRKGRTTKKRW